MVQADAIPDGWMGLDNGPEATKEIQAALKQVRHFFCLSNQRLCLGLGLLLSLYRTYNILIDDTKVIEIDYIA